MLSAEYVGAGPQLQRHIEIMQGEAGSPWQYRIMSVWLSEWSFSIASALGANYHVFWGFVGLRVLQLCAVFIAFYAYLQACRLGAVSAYLGLMVLAWSISHSVFDSDLAFHSFFDLLFYLVAMLLLISGRAWWLPAVMLVATLNHETSGMIAFLPLAYLARDADKQTITTTAMIAAASLMVYAIAFFRLRAYFPPQGSVLAYGHEPGLALIQYNLVRWMTWVRFVETFSLVPVIALLGYRVWPDFLKQLFWLLVPVWLAVHLWGGVLIETRLLLVPFALVTTLR